MTIDDLYWLNGDGPNGPDQPTVTDWSALDFPPDAASRAIRHARQLLLELGMLCDDDSTRTTPERMVKALVELTAGTRVDPARHLARTFPPPSQHPGLVIVPGVPFVSLCEHHMLSFTGRATVAYLPAPGARIVGLSKLARVVAEYAARPQVQERLGEQVVEAITSNLDTDGAACIIRSEHSCMVQRGARATGAAMVTSHMAGRFRDDPALRSELLALAGM